MRDFTKLEKYGLEPYGLKTKLDVDGSLTGVDRAGFEVIKKFDKGLFAGWKLSVEGGRSFGGSVSDGSDMTAYVINNSSNRSNILDASTGYSSITQSRIDPLDLSDGTYAVIILERPFGSLKAKARKVQP